MTISRLNAVILFAGGGVMDFGLGGRLNVALAIDNESWPMDAYRLNHPNVKTLQRDLLLDDPSQVLSEAMVYGCDLLHASPPCQAFSQASAIRFRHDRRKFCLLGPLGYARLLKPKFLVVENVASLASLWQGPTFLENLTEGMKHLGYKTDVWKLDAVNYGSFQKRKRLFIVGWRTRNRPLVPSATHGESPLLPFRTLGDAIGHLSENDAMSEGCMQMSKNRQRQMRGVKAGEKTCQSVKRLCMEQPCNALTTTPSCQKMSRFVHPYQDRHLSVVEYKLIMGIPEYRFPGGMPVPWKYRVTGNGNPPDFYEAVVNSMQQAL